MKAILLSLEKRETKTKLPDVPEAPVEAAGEKIIKELREKAVVIIPVTRNSNYLSANFVTADSITEKDMALLASLKKQLIWLNLGHKNFPDSLLEPIGELTNLTRLQLNYTAVTDSGIASLQSLTNLQYLNLVGTKVTANGLLPLKSLSNLQSIYLYRTFISSSDWPVLKSNFPKVTLDTGGYQVPFLATDTVIVKPPEKKN
jgi:Leucine-rich repeat (LRR) protein